jgi:RNA polymerase sigma-70 factor, ECF subfamily
VRFVPARGEFFARHRSDPNSPTYTMSHVTLSPPLESVLQLHGVVPPQQDSVGDDRPGGPLSTSETSDESLVVGVANGDRAALAALYDRYAGRLVGFARWLGLGSSDTEDIVHDLFLEVWHCAGDYDPKRAPVETWILVRLRSRVLDHYRRAGRRRTCPASDLDGIPAPGDGMLRVDHDLLLARGLACLSPCQRQVVVLAFLEGFSYDEIAERLAIPFGTVKSRLVSAIAKLREETREAHE